jgi:hypothetical protein
MDSSSTQWAWRDDLLPPVMSRDRVRGV